MKKMKLVKVVALCLSAVVLTSVGSSALSAKAEGETMTGAYLNFESGLPVATSSNGYDESVIKQLDDTMVLNWGVDTDDNKYVLYQPVTSDTNSVIRPKNVQFRFKTGVTDPNHNSYPYSFEVTLFGNEALANKWQQNAPKLKFSFNDKLTKNKLAMNCNYSNSVFSASISQRTKEVTNTTYNLATEPWYTYNCDYDWSQFKEGSYVVTCTITITEEATGTKFVDKDAITYTATSSVSVNDSFGIGFDNVQQNASWGYSHSCVDNVAVTWIDVTTNTEYKPTYLPEAKALGATLATTEGTDGTIKTQMGFEFTDARSALANNGKEVAEYGAVFVAGTVAYDTMKTNAATLLGGTSVDGYVSTSRKAAELPDEYRVTITNSDGENIGKRVTAIGYVKTTDGAIYYTGENTSDVIEQANLNNYSVMGTLKKIFNQTYLTDLTNGTDSDGDGMIDEITSDSALAKALASFNASATINDIIEATEDGVSSGNTTTGISKRELLKALHFGLYKNYQSAE